MLALGLGSATAFIFDVKHYFHLQLVPHISQHHQLWRLLTSQLIIGNSSDFMVAQLVLFNIAVNIERTFGSRKYGSFLLVSLALSIFLEFASLLLLYRTGVNYIPPGPLTLIFAIVYQHYRIVPTVYQFRISSLDISNKAFHYFLAFLLAISDPPGTTLAATIGIVTGYMYRSDLLNLKNWRVPPSVEFFSKRFLLPLVGSMRPPRRSNRALPPEASPSGILIRDQTTAPAAATNSDTPPAAETPANGTTPSGRPSMVSQWVDELTGRRGTEGLHVPTEVDIATLASMFPDTRREEIISALQRSDNIQSAVEVLLQRS
ncbi:hypothetical protein FRB99_007603 [Tulasnella sp. 403]|nr:hypothetical protein FRB99_007603 [Tulasnella sp. 403]